MKERKFPIEQLEGLAEVTTNNGIIQHVDKNGNLEKGKNVFRHSSDDQARLLQVWCRYNEKFNTEWFKEKLPEILINFAIESGKGRTDGLFNNYRNFKGEFIESGEGCLYDVYGRWMFALAEASASRNACMAGEAEKLFYEHLEAAPDVILKNPTPHSLAYLISAMSKKLEVDRSGLTPRILEVTSINLASTGELGNFYDKYSDTNWDWPSDEISYCGAIFPEAMFSASQAQTDGTFIEIGKRWLNFFTSASFKGDMFWPVGNNPGEDGVKWYKKDGEKSPYDQQTIEAGRAAVAYGLAYRITRDPEYLNRREQVINWFYGKNSAKKSLLAGKEVCDAVTPAGINTNQGAESRLAFLLGMPTVPYSD